MNKYIIDKNGYICVFINDILSLFLHLLSYHVRTVVTYGKIDEMVAAETIRVQFILDGWRRLKLNSRMVKNSD